MSNKETLGQSWEESLTSTLGVCDNLKKAYEIALFLGEISKPDSSYRKVLETIKVKGAYTLSQVGGDRAATIVQIKHY
jgi:hypothetical protein